MAAARDPDLLTLRHALRLLQTADPERFIEVARSVAFSLEALAERPGADPRRQAEARRLAGRVFACYPFEAAT